MKKVFSICSWLVVSLTLVACNQQSTHSSTETVDLQATVVPMTFSILENGAADGHFAFFEATVERPIPRMRIQASHPDGIDQIYLAIGPREDFEPEADFAFALCDTNCGSSDIDAWVSGLNPADLGLLVPSPDLAVYLLVDSGAGPEQVAVAPFEWNPTGISTTSATWTEDGLDVSWASATGIDRYNVYVLQNGERAQLTLAERKERLVNQRLGVTGTSVRLTGVAQRYPRENEWLYLVSGLNSSGEVAFSGLQPVPERPFFQSALAYSSPNLCWSPPGFLVAGSDTTWQLGVNDPENQVVVSHDAPGGLGLSLSQSDFVAQFSAPQVGNYTFTISADNGSGSVQTLGPMTINVMAETDVALTANEFSALANAYDPLMGDECGVVSRFDATESAGVVLKTINVTDNGIHIANNASSGFAHIARVGEAGFWDPGLERRGFLQFSRGDGAEIPAMVPLSNGGFLMVGLTFDSGANFDLFRVSAAGEMDLFDPVVSFNSNPEFTNFSDMTTGAMALAPEDGAVFVAGLADGNVPILQAVYLDDQLMPFEAFGDGFDTMTSGEFPLAQKLLFSDTKLYLLTNGDQSVDVYRVPLDGGNAGMIDANYASEGRLVLDSVSVPELVQPELLDAMDMGAGKLLLLMSDSEASGPLVLARVDAQNGTIDSGFGDDGFVVFDGYSGVQPTGAFGDPASPYRNDLALLNGDIYLLANNGDTRILRLDLAGNSVADWGHNGSVPMLGELAEARVERLVASAGQLHVVSNALAGPDWSITRLNADGQPDHSGNRLATVNFGHVVGDQAIATNWDHFDIESGLPLRYVVTELDDDLENSVKANLWQLNADGSQTGLTPAHDPWSNTGEPAYNFNFEPVGLFAQEGTVDLAGMRESVDWAHLVLGSEADGGGLLPMNELDYPSIWQLQELPGQYFLNSVFNEDPQRSVYSGWSYDGNDPNAGNNQFALTVLENNNETDPLTPLTFEIARNGDYMLPEGTQYSRAIAAYTAVREGIDIVPATFVVALVHTFDRDNNRLINERSELVTFSDESGEWSFEYSESLPTLDSRTPLDLVPIPGGNDFVVVSEQDGNVLAHRYNVQDTTPFLVDEPLQWVANEGNDISITLDSADALALSFDYQANALFLGGGLPDGKPVLGQFDGEDGSLKRAWSGPVLSRSEYAYVVDVQTEPVQVDGDTWAHLTVLMDTYHQARWQARLARLPFIAPSYGAPIFDGEVVFP